MNFYEIVSKCVKARASYRILRNHMFEKMETPNVKILPTEYTDTT
jgi:hypothetical protein